MPPLAALPLSLQLSAVLILGLMLGSSVNWAIYRLAWHRRDISPWGPLPTGAAPRTLLDRVPLLGWLLLRREHSLHGRGFWIRPLGIELLLGLGLAALYWWEVDQQGLVRAQIEDWLHLLVGAPLAVQGKVGLASSAQVMFLSHVILIGLMAAASFIDIDEKIIPDAITVPGTLLGLLLAAMLPMALLPHVATSVAPDQLRVPIELPAAVAQAAPGAAFQLEPVTLAAPNPWPEILSGAPSWQGLLLGLGCWWLWCFALTPRIWRGRHGPGRALRLIARRVLSEWSRPPLGLMALVGSLAIVGAWWFGGQGWTGLLSALVGMAGSGSMIWIVRLVGTAALQREAMGFGDVTLMMMVGAYLGWQAGVIIFFVAPFAGLIVGIMQLVLHRDDEIPYGPFLCLGSLVVMVCWADVWIRMQGVFQVTGLVPAVLVVCFVLLGLMLVVWRQIKRLFA